MVVEPIKTECKHLLDQVEFWNNCSRFGEVRQKTCNRCFYNKSRELDEKEQRYKDMWDKRAGR